MAQPDMHPRAASAMTVQGPSSSGPSPWLSIGIAVVAVLASLGQCAMGPYGRMVPKAATEAALVDHKANDALNQHYTSKNIERLERRIALIEEVVYRGVHHRPTTRPWAE